MAEDTVAGVDEEPVTAGSEVEPGEVVGSEENAYTDAIGAVDGSVVASVYQEPVNFRNGSGDWVDLDLALAEKDADSFAPAASGNPVEIDRFADADALVRLSLDGDPNVAEPGEGLTDASISFALRGAAPVEGVVAGSEVTYQGALPGVDVSISAQPLGVKEWLTLSGPSATRALRFDLDLQDATARLNSETGAVVLESPDGEAIGEIPRGWMVDGAEVTSHDVTWVLGDRGDGQYTLDVELDEAWLDDAARVWPVRVDPTVVRYDPNVGSLDSDTYVHSVAGVNRWAEQVLAVGNDPTFGTTASYIKFDALSQVLDQREIYFAALNLTSLTATNCRWTGYQVKRVTQNWAANTMTAWPGASYTNDGAGGDAFPFGFSGVNCSDSFALGRRSVVITDIAKLWARRDVPNYGLTIRANDSADPNHFKSFASSNFATTDQTVKPHIIVAFRSYGMRYSPQVVTPLSLTQNGRIRLGLQNLGDPIAAGSMQLIWRMRSPNGTQIRSGSGIGVPAMGTNGTSAVEFDVGTYTSSIHTIEFDIAHLGWGYFSAFGIGHPVSVPFEILSVPYLTSVGPGGYVTSLQPTLKASGKDDLHPSDPLTYSWELCSQADGGGTCSSRLNTGSSVAATTFTGYSAGLPPARHYSFRVKVRNSVTGQESAFSSWVNFRTYVLQPTEFGWGRDRYTELQHMVNPRTGALVYAAADSETKVAGPDLVLGRTYNSPNTQSVASGGFGVGWTHPWSARVISDEGSDSVLVVRADGQRERWARLTDGSFVAPPVSPGTTLTQQAGGYTLRRPDGSTHNFDSNGKLTSIVDRDGRQQTVTYVSGRLDRVTDVHSGRYLDFGVQTDGRITSVSTNPVDGVPEQWSYSYASGRLTQVCAPEPSTCWTYRYDASGRLDRVVEPEGNEAVEVLYRTDGTVQWIEHYGVRVGFTFDPPGAELRVTTIGYGPYLARYLVHDQLGRLVKHQAKAKGPQVGLITEYGYNDAGLVDSITTAGRTTSMAYDTHGRLLARTVPLSDTTSATTWFNYSTAHTNQSDPRFFLPAEVRGPRSTSATDNRFLTEYAYDTAGRVLFETGPAYDRDGNRVTRSFRYTNGTEAAVDGGFVPAGLLKAEAAAGRPNTLYFYDAAGDLRRVTTALLDESGLNPDPNAAVTEYGHDAIGNVTSHREINDHTGGQGALTLIHHDALNRVVGTVGPAVTHRVGEGVSQQVDVYTFDRNGNLREHRRAGQSGADSIWTGRYNAANRLYEETLPSGGTQYYTYTADHQVDVFTDARGAQIDHDYNDVGLLSRRTILNYRDEPSAQPFDLLAESFGYDAHGRLIEQVDSLGVKTIRSYTADDRLASESLRYFGPSSQWVNRSLAEYTYDAAGNTTSVKTANGTRRTDIAYDALNRPIRHADISIATGEEIVTNTTYDPHGRTTRIQGPGDALTTIGYDDLNRTSYRFEHLAYDVTGTSTTAPGLSALTVTQFDNTGRPAQVTDPRGGVTNISYDALGRPDQLQAPLALSDVAGVPTNTRATTEVAYDFVGNTTAQRDPEGRVTRFDYDTSDRLVRVDHPNYQPPGGATLAPYETWAYDSLGGLTSHRHRNGHSTDYLIDEFGRTYEQREPAPAAGQPRPTTQYFFNRNGQPVRMVTPTGATHDTWYDESRRPTHDRTYLRTANRWTSTVTTYNDADQPVTITSPEQRSTEIGYDGLGRTTYTENGADDRLTYSFHPGTTRLASITDELNRSTRYAYDRGGRRTETAYHNPAGVRINATQRSYSPAGDPISDTTALGHPTFHSYDTAGRLISTTEDIDGNPANAITTTTAYNRAGEPTRTTDGRGLETLRTYNTWGLIETEVEPPATSGQPPADRTWSRSYHLDGQLHTTNAPGGVVTTNTYDHLGRRVTVSGTGAEAPTPTATFAYDADDRLTSFTHPDGTQQLAYDDLNRPTSSTGPAGNSTWTYDDDNNILTLNQPGSSVTTTYDDANRPLTRTDSLTNTTQTHTYDDASQLRTTTYGTTRTRTYTYDDLGRPDTDTLTAGTTTLRSLDYTFDADHNLTQITRAGTGTHAFTYDRAGRLTSETPPGQPTLNIAWDKSSNRTSHGPTTYTYNNRNQLTSSNDGTTYTWRPRGVLATKTTSAGTTTHTYTAHNQPATIGTITYTHDALGREARRNSAQLFRYAGTATTPSSFGNQTYASIDNQVIASKVPASTDPSLHINDQLHGDYNASLHPTGTTLTATRAYNPFGATTTETGAALPRTGYQGDWTDPTTQLLHTNRRVYDPTTSGFTTRDQLARGADGSPGHNRYLYGAANPLSHTDRHGTFAFAIPVVIYAAGYIGAAVGAVVAGNAIGTALQEPADAALDWWGEQLRSAGSAIANTWNNRAALGTGVGFAAAILLGTRTIPRPRADGGDPPPVPACTHCRPPVPSSAGPALRIGPKSHEIVSAKFPAGTPLTGLGAIETVLDTTAGASGTNVSQVTSILTGAMGGLLAVDGYSEAADDAYNDTAPAESATTQPENNCGPDRPDLSDAVDIALDVYDQLQPDDTLPAAPLLPQSSNDTCPGSPDSGPASEVSGAADDLPQQLHHFATNKNSVFTPRMQSIADRYELDLDGAWNKELTAHLGRHPNAYHEFVLDGMESAAREAGPDSAKFLELFEQYVKEPVRSNPELLRRSGWGN